MKTIYPVTKLFDKFLRLFDKLVPIFLIGELSLLQLLFPSQSHLFIGFAFLQYRLWYVCQWLCLLFRHCFCFAQALTRMAINQTREKKQNKKKQKNKNKNKNLTNPNSEKEQSLTLENSSTEREREILYLNRSLLGFVVASEGRQWRCF